MANLTLAIDDKLVREARVKALEQGTSVNEVCRQAIERLADRNEGGERLAAGLRASFAAALPRPPGAGPAWEGREARTRSGSVRSASSARGERHLRHPCGRVRLRPDRPRQV